MVGNRWSRTTDSVWRRFGDDLDDVGGDTDDVTMVRVLVVQPTLCLVTAKGVGSSCRRVTLWRSCRHTSVMATC
jgi:hypothetical protein